MAVAAVAAVTDGRMLSLSSTPGKACKCQHQNSITSTHSVTSLRSLYPFKIYLMRKLFEEASHLYLGHLSITLTTGNADAAAAPKPVGQSPKKHAGQHFSGLFISATHSQPEGASRPCIQLIFETHLIKCPTSTTK